MQSPGKWHIGKVSHTETTTCDALMTLGNEKSTSYLLGVRTAHVKGGSRRFRYSGGQLRQMSDENYWCMHVWLHFLFLIKATCDSCARFGWDTQACIQAIGTRDVSSEWISKYAFDLKRSSISTSTKTGVQKVKCMRSNIKRTWAIHWGPMKSFTIYLYLIVTLYQRYHPSHSWFWSGSDRIDLKSALRHLCCLKFCLDFLWRLMNFIQIVRSPSCIFHVIVQDEIRKNLLNTWRCRY